MVGEGGLWGGGDGVRRSGVARCGKERERPKREARLVTRPSHPIKTPACSTARLCLLRHLRPRPCPPPRAAAWAAPLAAPRRARPSPARTNGPSGAAPAATARPCRARHAARMSISVRRHSRPVVCTTGLGAPLLEPGHHLSRGKVDPKSLLHQGEPEDLVLAAHEQVRHRLHAGRTRPRWHGPGWASRPSRGAPH